MKTRYCKCSPNTKIGDIVSLYKQYEEKEEIISEVGKVVPDRATFRPDDSWHFIGMGKVIKLYDPIESMYNACLVRTESEK